MRTAVRKFCADNFDEPTVRRLMESDVTFDARVWNRLGSELGVLGLSVPEADGGAGGSLVDQAVAVEEFGAALACGPLFGTVFLAIPALVACPAGRRGTRCWASWWRAPAPPRSPSPIRPAPSMPTRWPWPPGRAASPARCPGDRRRRRRRTAGRGRRPGRPGPVRRGRRRGRSPTHTVGHPRPDPPAGQRRVQRCARAAAGRARRGGAGDRPCAACRFGAAGRRTGRGRAASAGSVRGLRQGPAAVRPPDRLLPGDQTQAGRHARRPRARPVHGLPRGLGAHRRLR